MGKATKPMKDILRRQNFIASAMAWHAENRRKEIMYCSTIAHALVSTELAWTDDVVKLETDVGKYLERNRAAKDYRKIKDRKKAENANHEMFVWHGKDGGGRVGWSLKEWDLHVPKQSGLFGDDK